MGFKFNLGSLVECSLTGVRGRVLILVKDIYSANRYCIQPRYNDKEGKMPSSVIMDEPSLVLIENETKYPLYEDGEFQFGDLVKDTLFGKEGKIKDRRLNINGCYSLSLAFLNDKGETMTFQSQEKACVLVKRREVVGVNKESRETGCEMVLENIYE